MKITVITVTYNSAATLVDTLQSVAAQTHPDIEHLIIDGGSTDQTLALVQSHGTHVARVVSERDRGIYDAMNKGLHLACGDVIGFINADDFYPTPDTISKVAAAFEADPTLECVYGDLCYVKQFETDQIVRYWRSSTFKPGMFLRGWCPPHPTLFVKRSVYERFDGFDVQYKIAADVELMARMIEVKRVKSGYLPHVLVHMRLGGMTNRSWSNVWKQNREIWRAFKVLGLRPSWIAFVVGKALSRSKQFLTRPA